MSVASPNVPLGIRVQLAEAAIQQTADEIGVDILHVKGYALDPHLRWPGRRSSDADILVRPDHLRALGDTLQSRGWNRVTGFEEGSSFAHSLTLRHEVWGYADVHRLFPGLGPDPAASFDILWRDRHANDVAGTACTVPSAAGQALILMLHAARAKGQPNAARDLETAWTGADEQSRAAIRELVAELGAEVGFAAATGTLDAYRDRPDYLLWKVASQGGTRFEDWWAQFRAAGSPGKALLVAARAPLVNVEHLARVLGRQPTRAEIVKEFFARPWRGLREVRTTSARGAHHERGR